ncbi:Zinc finger, C3HC4 RING-type [Artemisia annua]|uniref:Zinc finger, C3HC4 RING-type n=1 Tax=Artemisia annua TaxID=35608 RepID=A0A2U1Q4W6_ARTAN|nr:Zinc finger, C3HC4 RING-type [Artemisia annua]
MIVPYAKDRPVQSVGSLGILSSAAKSLGNSRTKKKGKEYDKMTTALAKKNNWKKCPKCKFFVEKTDGCRHIRCRCKYDFCYTCGGKLHQGIVFTYVYEHILNKWEELSCESTILRSQKIHCPFADCSALLIIDDISITKNICPVCNWLFCAVCSVLRHSEFSCK